MKLKNLLLVLTLLILTSQKTAYGQESDTICLSVSDVKILASSHEKLIFADSLIKIQDEEIFLLTEIVQEKVNQQQLTEGLLNQLRNEVGRLKRHRMLLGVGLGMSIVGVLFLAF